MVEGTLPIESAPRDGRPICIGDGGQNYAKAFWDDARGWCYVYTWGGKLIEEIPFEPTCWSAHPKPFLDAEAIKHPFVDAPEFLQRAADPEDDGALIMWRARRCRCLCRALIVLLLLASMLSAYVWLGERGVPKTTIPTTIEEAQGSDGVG